MSRFIDPCDVLGMSFVFRDAESHVLFLIHLIYMLAGSAVQFHAQGMRGASPNCVLKYPSCEYGNGFSYGPFGL